MTNFEWLSQKSHKYRRPQRFLPRNPHPRNTHVKCLWKSYKVLQNKLNILILSYSRWIWFKCKNLLKHKPLDWLVVSFQTWSAVQEITLRQFHSLLHWHLPWIPGLTWTTVCRFKSQPYYRHLTATPSFGRADSWGVAFRRRQLSALQTMELPLDGDKYDSLLIFTVTDQGARKYRLLLQKRSFLIIVSFFFFLHPVPNIKRFFY